MLLLVLAGGPAIGRADELDVLIGPGERTYPDLVPEVAEVFIDRPILDFRNGTFVYGPPTIWFDTWAQNLGTVSLELTADDLTGVLGTTVSQCVAWEAPFVCRDRTTVGDLQWHDDHLHFHYQDFATYELRHRDPDGSPNYSPAGLIDKSEKVSFCMLDSTEVEDAETQAPTETFLVCSHARQGISPGYADIYTSDIEGQQLVLGNLPDGLYSLVVTLDDADKLFETDDTNNRLVATVKVSDNAAVVEVVQRAWPTLGTEDDDLPDPEPTTTTTSTTSTTAPPVSRPGAPGDVAATAGDRLATVTWSPPADDGGSPVTGYRVTSSPPGSELTTGPDARSAVFTDLDNGRTYTFRVRAANVEGEGPAAASNPVTPTAPPQAQGYALLADDGDVMTFGAAAHAGSLRSLGITPNEPPNGMAYTPSGNGYWIAAGDGGVFAFGDARFYGSMGGKPLNAPVLGMEPTPSGDGYWLFAADGGIFSFGDARFHGSMGGTRLNAPVVGMAATGTGRGYWLVAQDGGVFSFGDAVFHGSMGGQPLNQPVFDMAAAGEDDGYWLVARDGGVFSFGSAASRFYGSAATAGAARVVGMGTTPTGAGYWIVDRAGAVFPFGDAEQLGEWRNGGRAIVGFAAVPRRR